MNIIVIGLPSLLNVFLDQLDDVINLLVKCGFPPARWRQLGLKLGLDRNTLATIAKDNSKAEDCFIECIARWLHRVDSVDSIFDSLSAALRSIFEKAVADKLDQESKLIMYSVDSISYGYLGKPLEKAPARTRVGTRVSLTVEKIENPSSSPDTIHKFKNRQEPGRDNIGPLAGHFERGTLEEVKIESKGIYNIIKRFFNYFC